jgi:hypothetical protein
MANEVISCVSVEEMNYFLNLIGPIWDWISETTLVVHSKTGDVFWEWIELDKTFCHMEHTSFMS